jgi:cardiolipin synthase
MHASGIKVLPFRPFKITGSLGRVFVRMFRRNHRKALVVDGLVGFTGGLNISDDYASLEDGGRGWRDTHVRIVGPSAQALERLFLNTWAVNRGPTPRLERFRRPMAAGHERVRIIGNDFALDRKDIRRAYLDAFSHAQHTIFLTHSYFLPPAKVLKAMIRASRRGVRVAVILAAATDVKLLLFAARGLYGRLLKNRVEVYEWQGRVLHAKTAVVDTRWSTVGSTNLDAQSLRQNLEVNAVFLDTPLAQSIEQLFLDDLTHCERITFDTVRGYGWVQRLVSWLAYQVRFWL